MPEFLSFNALGELYLTMPPADLVRARVVRDSEGMPDFVVDFACLDARVSMDWISHVQYTFTAALCEAGYPEECTTPESLARKAGAA